MAVKFAKREKYVITIGALLIFFFFLFQLAIFPFFEKREYYQRGILKKEKDLNEISLLSAKYREVKEGASKIERVLAKRDKGFTLFSFLERAAGEARVKDRIKYMRPRQTRGQGIYKESLVEMKLEGVTLDQLVQYLYQVEKPEDFILVKRISINDDKKRPGYLDSIIQVFTFL